VISILRNLTSYLFGTDIIIFYIVAIECILLWRVLASESAVARWSEKICILE
jgi:hypothetical protein